MMNEENVFLMDKNAADIAIDDLTLTVGARWIDPTLAGKLLQRMVKNRKVNEDVVRKYAADMKGNRWLLNGETIIIDDSGYMTNGQHRCLACIRSGCDFPSLIVIGVPSERDTFNTTDQGAPRKLSSLLHMEDVPYSAKVGPAIKQYMHFVEHGWFNNDRTTRWRSNLEWIHILDSHKEVVASVNFIMSRCKKLRPFLPETTAAAMHAIFSQLHKARADTFFESLASGDGLSADDAVFVLRERLIADKDARTRQRLAASGPHPGRQSALVIKAWNVFVADRTIIRLSYSPRGERPSLLGWRRHEEQQESLAIR
jgi:hypothetical protein